MARVFEVLFMLRNITLVFFICVFSTLSSQNWNWIKSDFSQNKPYQWMACDDNNGVYLAFDDKLVKYDTSGTLLWQQSLSTLTISTMEAMKDGVVISGRFLGLLTFGQFSVNQMPNIQMV